MNCKPLIVSAPFGNYVQPDFVTSTTGTFTRHARPNSFLWRPALAWRFLVSVRRYRRLGAWVNKLGLKNPGIDWLIARHERGLDAARSIVSVHGFDLEDWRYLLQHTNRRVAPVAVELNVSCPNVEAVDQLGAVFSLAVKFAQVPIIVKLPPVNAQVIAAIAHERGLRTFHCCNTLPVPGGGMSGKPLKPVSLVVIRDLRDTYGDEIDIIGGGGITCEEDIDDYREVGANMFAVGTMLFTRRGRKRLGALAQYAAAER